MTVSPTGGNRSAELAMLKQGGAIVAREAGASDLGLRPANRPASTASNAAARFVVNHQRSIGVASAATGVAALAEAVPLVGGLAGGTFIGRLTIGSVVATGAMKAGEGAGYVQEQSKGTRILKGIGAGILAAIVA